MPLANSQVPIPTPASPIDTHNAHSVTVWIKERQKAGTLKRCAHLAIVVLRLVSRLRRRDRF